MKIFKAFLLILSLYLFLNASAQDYHVRVAFIGNSITIGSWLANPSVECYPSRVDQMLKEIYGDTCIVQNFAVSGRTILKKGDYPIWNEPTFPLMWKFAPDIVYILMGTNDSKPYNWKYGNEFFDDYMSMIDTMKVRNPRTKFIISLPPPAFGVLFDIQPEVIANEVIPIIDSIQAVTGAELVDFYHPLLDSAHLFIDKIHPTAEGAMVMAKMVVDKILETNIIHEVETGYTFVTNVKTDQKVLRPGDPAKISWTTINADSVMIDGDKYDANGSVTVNPAITTKYTVYGYGLKSVDSMSYSQTVYIPELDKIVADPRSKTVDQYDSLKITLKFYDQENKAMTNAFNVEWKIREGGGTLINKITESVTFIATLAGVSYVVARVGEDSAQVKITINEKVGVEINKLNNSINVFPNPATHKLNFELFTQQSSQIEAKIYDMKGSLCLKRQFMTSKNVKNKFEINLGSLSPGIYLFEINGSEKLYSGRIVKEAYK